MQGITPYMTREELEKVSSHDLEILRDVYHNMRYNSPIDTMRSEATVRIIDNIIHGWDDDIAD